MDRFGSYTRGQRKFATSAVDNERQVSVNPDQEMIDLNSDDSSVQVVDPPAKKQRTVDDNVLWDDLPLLPDTDLDALDDMVSDGIESDEDSAISITSIATSEGIHIFGEADLLELEQGYAVLFIYECVNALPHGVYENSPRPLHECRDKLLGLTKDDHMDVVMIGEGFTNSV